MQLVSRCIANVFVVTAAVLPSAAAGELAKAAFAHSAFISPAGLVVANKRMFMGAYQPATGFELWSSDVPPTAWSN